MRTRTLSEFDEATNHGWHRAFARWTVLYVQVCPAAPVLWLACFYSFVIRMRLLAGAWPPNSGSYEQFANKLQTHARLLGVGLAVLPLIFTSWLPIAGFAVLSHRWITNRRFLALFALWLAIPLFALLDPFHQIRWFFFQGSD